MVSHHLHDGHPPSQGWSTPIQNIPERIVLQPWNLVSRIDQQNLDQVKCHGWSATIPRMVTHHSKPTRRKCTTDLKFVTVLLICRRFLLVLHYSLAARPALPITVLCGICFEKELAVIWNWTFTISDNLSILKTLLKLCSSAGKLFVSIS